MSVLLLKVTVFLLAGLFALLATGKSTAATRHLLCACTLAGSLLLPFGSLLPARAIAFQTNALDDAAVRSPAIAGIAAWPWSAAIECLWALGTALLLLRLALGYWRAGRLVREATPIDPPLFASDVKVPLVSGLLRPVVLMPRDAAEWPAWQHAAAVRHELAHIERKDLWANLAANFACALYWFHPLAWALSSRMRREQEDACDDAVLHSGFDPALYAEALLAVAKQSAAVNFAGCPMATHAGLKSRIARLLGRGTARTASHGTLTRSAAAFAGILLAFAALSCLRAQHVYRVGGDVTSPRMISHTEPQYTEEARRGKIAGTVVLSVVIGTDGLAHDIRVSRRLDPGLDRSAAGILSQWRFAPGTLRGMPVPVKATIEVNFRLL